MLVDVKEKCINCNQELGDHDFVYRHKAPGGYVFSNCGFYYLYENEAYEKNQNSLLTKF